MQPVNNLQQKYVEIFSLLLVTHIHRISKNSQNCFWHNFAKFTPILIIIGTKIAKTILLCTVQLFTISPYLC